MFDLVRLTGIIAQVQYFYCQEARFVVEDYDKIGAVPIIKTFYRCHIKT